MPLDVPLSEVELLWIDFRAYICAPYQNNPERLAEIEIWFDELYARRKKNELVLSGCDIETRNLFPLYGHKQRAFEAYCLNDQMFFSHSPAVLALPYAPSGLIPEGMHGYPDRFVGIWLHDFGQPDLQLKKLFEKGTSQPVASYHSPYLARLANSIARELMDPVLPGKKANILLPEADSQIFRVVWEHEIKSGQTTDFGRHRDSYAQYEKEWSRVVLHSLRHTGTIYYVGASENIKIMSPPGATSSHISCDRYTGASHRAGRHPAGRAITRSMTQAAGRLLRRPWNIRFSRVSPQTLRY